MPAARSSRRWVWVAALLGAVVFALQGGEYSSMDLVRQKDRRASLQQAIDSLQRDVDSLTALRKLVRTDARFQERIARERYGMVRGEKEIVYRFIDAIPAKP
jgi:cell division protein FtsB